jgi:L-serine dehydratase
MFSVFELFKIGVGPSSSHTVGPMKAAKAFVDALAETGRLDATTRIVATLYGSLAWTGKGHGTDRATILGLAGAEPATVDPDEADRVMARLDAQKMLRVGGARDIAFDPASDLLFDMVSPTPRHPNTMQLVALDASGAELTLERWCSVGGGFVVREDDADAVRAHAGAPAPYTFRNAAELLRIGAASGLSIAEMMMANELARRPREDVAAHLRAVADVMFACIDRGLTTSGQLPGGLKVRRRAPAIFAQLQAARGANARAAHEVMDFISVFAIAVNEENAAGGRVVTAPTNGAAGVVPSVLRYYRDFCIGASPEGIDAFLLTAAAVGSLFKMNASISGAEVGCQGEVGVACSMAAAGLAAALGATNAQIENAAEIGMEHHLGMTCDPIGGLVQIPCIERNAFGAISAVNAASLAMRGDGAHHVSLDQVIATMRQTGADMHDKYKETSRGGLAVNWVEC